MLAAPFVLVGRAMRGGGDGSALVRVHDGDGATHACPLAADGDHVVATSLGTNTIRVREGTVLPSTIADHADPLRGRLLGRELWTSILHR